MKKILVGGQALKNLGSSRHTEDVDYLVFDENNSSIFIKEEGTDLLNAAAFNFFNEIYKLEEKNAQASAQSLLELKSYAFVQHCQLGNWKKVADCEFDMAFLVRECGAEMPKIVKKYISAAEWTEVEKEIKSIRK
jgi:hypothetical protein